MQGVALLLNPWEELSAVLGLLSKGSCVRGADAGSVIVRKV